jgi:hypothetical protein
VDESSYTRPAVSLPGNRIGDGRRQPFQVLRGDPRFSVAEIVPGGGAEHGPRKIRPPHQLLRPTPRVEVRHRVSGPRPGGAYEDQPADSPDRSGVEDVGRRVDVRFPEGDPAPGLLLPGPRQVHDRPGPLGAHLHVLADRQVPRGDAAPFADIRRDPPLRPRAHEEAGQETAPDQRPADVRAGEAGATRDEDLVVLHEGAVHDRGDLRKDSMFILFL